MNNMCFKDYLNENISFNYLKNYYNSSDVASIYGINKYEIKHSNFLKWLLEPKNSNNIEMFPIKRLLKIIQNNIDNTTKNGDYKKFKSLLLDKTSVSDLKVAREENNIDLLISLKLDEQKYIIVIENKIESRERENQLYDYKKSVGTNYDDNIKLFCLLHPNYSQLRLIDKKESLKESSFKNDYISITYQDIYDNILDEYSRITNEMGIRFLIYDYIHTLSCYTSKKLNGLIINNEEQKNIEDLVNDKEILEMMDNIIAKKDNIYTETYSENRELFNKIFEKYKIVNENNQNQISEKINDIFKTRMYKFDKNNYKSASKLVYAILNDIIEKKKIKSLSEFGDELKDRLTNKDWYISEKYDGIEKVFGGIQKDTLLIGNTVYYVTNYVSYEALLELYELIIKMFPDYEEKICIM